MPSHTLLRGFRNSKQHFRIRMIAELVCCVMRSCVLSYGCNFCLRNSLFWYSTIVESVLLFAVNSFSNPLFVADLCHRWFSVLSRFHLGRYVLPKRWYSLAGPHGLTTQKTRLSTDINVIRHLVYLYFLTISSSSNARVWSYVAPHPHSEYNFIEMLRNALRNETWGCTDRQTDVIPCFMFTLFTLCK
jgi:hypothetical protein